MTKRITREMAEAVVDHLAKGPGGRRPDHRFAGRPEEVVNGIEATIQEHLGAFFERICPKGAVLFCIEEDDEQFRVNVIAGDRLVGNGIIEFGMPDGSRSYIAMAMSEFASEFEGCATPGQALHAYADGLDAVLAREAWQERDGRVVLPPRCNAESGMSFCAFIQGHAGPCSWSERSVEPGAGGERGEHVPEDKQCFESRSDHNRGPYCTYAKGHAGACSWS